MELVVGNQLQKYQLQLLCFKSLCDWWELLWWKQMDTWFNVNSGITQGSISLLVIDIEACELW